jgi:hypothetical protein
MTVSEQNILARLLNEGEIPVSISIEPETLQNIAITVLATAAGIFLLALIFFKLKK